MKLNIGDKVRFLNENGGGVVTRIINTNLVSVAIEDGFDIPTLASNLIRIEAMNGPSSLFDKNYEIELPVPDPKLDVYSENQQSKLRPARQEMTHPQGLYLAFIPHDQKWLITGVVDIYIINNSDYSVLYSFNLRGSAGNYSGIDFASIEPNTKALIESISREDLESWSEGVIQALFHKDETDKILKPVNESFKVKPVKFYKEESYIDSSIIDGKAIMVSLCEISANSSPILDADYGKNTTIETNASYSKPLSTVVLIDKHRVAGREAEVDLHISALRDNYEGLSNHEILQIQVSYFDRSLESAILNNYAKVIYIHGIGNGILKASLINKLKEYEDIEFRNAAFARYGNGAIEIIIHKNR
ncbi:MAG: DUF2027 domain-containing protein [Bacteroidales bacterium]